MEKNNSERRFEFKAVINASECFAIEKSVRLCPLGLTSPYPPRFVNNIYFDTLELDSYNDNLSGQGRRVKLRLRWYGPLSSFSKSQLEMKNKENDLGWKIIIKLEDFFDLNAMSWIQVRKIISRAVKSDTSLSQKNKNGMNHVFHLYDSPAIINRFYRHYYQSFDDKLRVTLDRNVSSYDQRSRIGPNIAFKNEVLDELAILEFKSALDDIAELKNVINFFPAGLSKSSKYVRGIDAGILQEGS